VWYGHYAKWYGFKYFVVEHMSTKGLFCAKVLFIIVTGPFVIEKQ